MKPPSKIGPRAGLPPIHTIGATHIAKAGPQIHSSGGTGQKPLQALSDKRKPKHPLAKVAPQRRSRNGPSNVNSDFDNQDYDFQEDEDYNINTPASGAQSESDSDGGSEHSSSQQQFRGRFQEPYESAELADSSATQRAGGQKLSDSPHSANTWSSINQIADLLFPSQSNSPPESNPEGALARVRSFLMAYKPGNQFDHLGSKEKETIHLLLPLLLIQRQGVRRTKEDTNIANAKRRFLSDHLFST